MKIILTCARRPLFYLWLLTGTAFAQTATVAETYPDGSPKMFYETRDSLADGRWTEWYPDGTLRFRARWRAGKAYGRWQYFYPDGQLRSDEVYEDDRPVGLSQQYHPNGQLAVESEYVAGELHGMRRTFSPTGIPEEVFRYERGERVIDRPAAFGPGVITTSANEWGLGFVPSGDTVYFTRRRVGEQRQHIFRSILSDTGWMTPTVSPFSIATDESPFVTRDGQWLYFASYRPLPGRATAAPNDMNLWRVRRRNDSYGPAEPLGKTINRVKTPDDPWPYAYEAGPHLDAAGRLYYWSAPEAGGSADLLRSEPDGAGGFEPPHPLTDLNTATAESAAALSPDGKFIFFSSYNRADGYGMEDLYVARRNEDGYGESLNLGPIINGSGNEGCATFSPDGRYFYFCRDEGEGTPSNIFFVETRFLPLPR